jgi:hypothetical protein
MAAKMRDMKSFHNFTIKNESFSRLHLLIGNNASWTSLAAEFAVIKINICRL